MAGGGVLAWALAFATLVAVVFACCVWLSILPSAVIDAAHIVVPTSAGHSDEIHHGPTCCSPVFKAARALTDGYYTTSDDYEFVPYAKALRTVNDSVYVEPFDLLILSDSLDRLMIESVCKKLPSAEWLPAMHNKFPGFGEGRAICRSAWGNITWLLITGSRPTGPYHHVGDEKEFYTPARIDAAIASHAAERGRAPHVLLFHSNLWDVALLHPDNIGSHEPGISHFRQFMEPFSYADASVATRWLRRYVRDTEANLARIRRAAPAPGTLLLARTSPLTNHRLQSSVNTATRRIAERACMPLVDWDELARVHMLDDVKWAQVQQGWYADHVHPAEKPMLVYGFLLLRFVRYFMHSLRGGSGGDAGNWAQCGANFLDWIEEPEL